jgi:pimeloyl-ACP methyl ester carboxylesterase
LQSPYETNQVFMASIANNRPLHSNIVPIEFKNEWFYSNVMGFESIFVDFGDGNGQIQVSDGFKREITYPDTGTYTITYHIITNSGTLTAHSSIRIARLRPSIDLNIPISSPNNLHSGVEVQVRYGCGRNRLMKPLIFVHGFEFAGIFNPDFDLQYAFEKIKNSPGLANPFESYDLVFIKFNEPQDDLLKNAQALIAAISKINNVKKLNGSSEPNLVIGESMGGLIARLALHEMEQQQLTNPDIQHDCHRLILLDSPHQGANVPLAFQAMVDEIGNSILNFLSPVQDAIRTLQSMAAQQMLIYHINHPNGNSVHAELMAALQNANPQQCRVIGISNGVDNGNGQGFQPGDPFVNQVVLFTPNAVGSKNRLLGLLTALVPVHFEFILVMNSAPNFSPTPFLLYQTEASITLFWGLKKIHLIDPALGIVANMYPYDSAPGGFISLNSGFSFIDSTLLEQDRFGYIPTPSGLNMPGQMQITAPYLNFNGLNVANVNNGGNGWSNFDLAVRESNLTSENTYHMDITPINGPVIRNQMIDWATGAGFNSPTFIGNATFNYGQTASGIKTNISHTTNTTVGLNGILCVNCSTIVGNSAMGNPGFASTPSFGVAFIRGGCNAQGIMEITINNTGKLIIGTNASQYSKSHFGSNTRLIIKSGGTLEINDNSSLSIDAGASIVFEAGSNLVLNGGNAVLEISGGLVLHNAPGFVFQYSGNGFVRFKNSPVLSTTNDPKFAFIGNGINDKILEIAAGTTLNLNGNVAELQLENGLVELGYQSSLEAFTKIILRNAIVTGSNNAEYKRFSISAKSGSIIRNVTFRYGETALQLGNFTWASTTIENCTFSNNKVGLLLSSPSNSIIAKQNNFTNNLLFGIKGEGISHPVVIDQCNIQGSQVGISLLAWNMSQIEIKNTQVQVSQTGMRLFSGNITISETNLIGQGNNNNSVGLLVEGNSVVRPRCVNISNFHVGTDLSPNCHLNLASGSTSNIIGNGIGIYATDAFLSVQNASSRLDGNTLASIYGKLKPSPEFLKQQINANSESLEFFKWPVSRLKINPQPFPAINSQGVIINSTSPFKTNDFTAVNGSILQINENLELPIFIDCINCHLTFACETVSEPPYYSEWILDPANGATGRIIYSSYFPGVEYLSALRSALDNITFVPDNPVNDLLAVLQLKQLLSLNLNNLSETEHQAKLAASKYMGMALTNAYAYGQLNIKSIQNPGPLSEEELFLLDLLESQKNGENVTDAEIVIAQAQIYRLASHYHTAIDLVNSQEASYAANNKQGYWSCLLPLEYNYLAGEIDLEAFLQMSADCGNVWQMRKKPYPSKNMNEMQLANQNLLAYPNPGTISFELKTPNLTNSGTTVLTVTDNLGRVILCKPYQMGDITSTQGWPSGLYHISIQSNQSKLHTSWIKQ